MKPAPVRTRYYRVGAQDSDLHYASEAEAWQSARAWERANHCRVRVYRVDVTETWTSVRQPRAQRAKGLK